MDETITDRVATAIRVELARKRVSAASVAKHLGISPTSLSRRLSGDVPIDVNELAAIAQVLGVRPEFLLGADVVVAESVS